MNKLVLWSIVGGVILIGLIIFLMSINITNKEVRLRNAIAAQEKSNTVIYDKVWKVLQQKAGVSEQYKDSFKDIYVGLMEGRYATGGEMMKWITESNPNFDASIYKDLMNSIEGLRGEFANVQNKLIDLSREHNNMLATVPSKWFLGGVQPVEIKLVTSSKTTETFETGEENDIDLFNNKSTAEKP